MSRFWRRRRAHPGDWTSTPRGWSSSAGFQRGEYGVSPVIRAGGATRLSEGSVIRATVLARLLGIRLLRLEADIALVPAGMVALPPVGPPDRLGTTHAHEAGAGRLSDAVELLAQASRTLSQTRPPVPASGPDP
jgi:hypothetical protein